jgi:N6-adenosine-specific RNA methylase IME4
MSVNALSPEELTEMKSACLKAFPTHKKYDVIYADPPWSFGATGKKIANQAADHYPTMSIEQLSALPVKEISAKNCALFMWVCNPLLPEALELITNWGFKYKTVFKVWTKRTKDGNPVCVPGWWSRGSTEQLLVASKGSPLQNKTTNCERQEFASLRGSHSEKPDEIREAVRNFLMVKDRLELFGRKSVADWDVWGLECTMSQHFIAHRRLRATRRALLFLL